MSRAADAASRRARRLEEDLRKRTGDDAWTVRHSAESRKAGGGRVLRIAHPLITRHDRRDLIATTDFDALDRPTPARAAEIDEIVRRVEFRRRHGDGPDMSAVWAHPLVMAIALPNVWGVRCEEPQDAAGIPIDHEDGMVCAEDVAIDERGTRRLRTCPAETTLEMDDVLPEAIALAAAGRPLRHLVEIPLCGQGDVDRAVDALVVRRVVTTAAGTIIHLDPADLLLWDGDGHPITDRPHLAVANFTPDQ